MIAEKIKRIYSEKKTLSQMMRNFDMEIPKFTQYDTIIEHNYSEAEDDLNEILDKEDKNITLITAVNENTPTTQDKLNAIKQEKYNLSSVIENRIGDVPNFEQYAAKFNDSFNHQRTQLNDILDIDYEQDIPLKPIQKVYCWGDSLTMSYGANNGSDGHPPIIEGNPWVLNYPTYPWALQQLLDKNDNDIHVENYGIGGIGVQVGAILKGALPVYIDQFTIPADSTDIPIYSSTSKSNIVASLHFYDDNPQPPGRDKSRRITTDEPYFYNQEFNPCMINGVVGSLMMGVGSLSSQMFFRRKEVGQQVDVPSKTQIFTHGSYSGCDDDVSLPIIWLGTNNNNLTIEEIMQYINDMIKMHRSGRYIVIGLTKTLALRDKQVVVDRPTTREDNIKLKAHYGKNFLDVRTLLVKDSIDWMISMKYLSSPTQEDIEDMKNDELPKSIRSIDRIHFNRFGYEFIAKCIYEHGKEMNYWN